MKIGSFYVVSLRSGPAEPIDNLELGSQVESVAAGKRWLRNWAREGGIPVIGETHLVVKVVAIADVVGKPRLSFRARVDKATPSMFEPPQASPEEASGPVLPHKVPQGGR